MKHRFMKGKIYLNMKRIILLNLSFASAVYLRFLKTKNIKYELIYNTGHLYFVKHSHKQKYLLFFFPFLIIFFFLGFGLPISYQKEKIHSNINLNQKKTFYPL